MTTPARKPTPAVRVDLPGGATLARASGPGQAFTCSRCGKSSGPAVVDKNHDTTTEIAAWAERHRGGECRP